MRKDRHAPGVVFAYFLSFLAVNAWKVMIVDHAFELPKLWSMAWVAATIPPYLLIVLTFSLLLLLTARARIWAAVYILQTIFLFIHYAYFIYCHRPFYSRQFILQFFEGLALVQHADVPLNPQYLLIFCDIPLILALVMHRRVLTSALSRWRTKLVALTAVLVLCLACFIGWTFHWAGDSYRKDVYDYQKGDASGLSRYGVLGMDFLDMIFFGDEKSIIGSISYDAPREYRAPRPILKKSVICIQVESLDAQAMSLTHNGRFIAPFLRQLSLESIYYPFMQYYLKAGSTSDTEFVALNSVMPLENFPILKLRGYDYPNSVARRLADAGFDVLAFHNNDQEYFNRGYAFNRMGFRVFYDRRKMGLKQIGWGASDRRVLTFAQRLLETQEQPFFYYVITMSSHNNFRRVRRYYSEPHYDDIPHELTRDYFNAISYVDDVLKNFVTFARERFPDAYIFIYGDHGPYTLPPTPFFTPSEFVPLLIITPDGRRHVECERVACAFDLAPTFLAAAGIDYDLRTQGINLLDVPVTQNLITLPSGKSSDRRALFASANRPKNTAPTAVQPLPYIADAGGMIDGISDTNSFEAMYESYEKGYKLIELDFQWTADDALVMVHDWEKTPPALFNAPSKVYTLNEFRDLKMVRGLHQMTLDVLLPWLKSRPGVSIVTDIKIRNIEGLQRIPGKYRHRFIPQVFTFEEYNAAQQLGFQNIILTLYHHPGYTDEEILRFVRTHKVWAVTMPVKRARTRLPHRLKKLGVFVYAHTVGDEKTAAALQAQGVSGFYSDTLGP